MIVEVVPMCLPLFNRHRLRVTKHHWITHKVIFDMDSMFRPVFDTAEYLINRSRSRLVSAVNVNPIAGR